VDLDFHAHLRLSSLADELHKTLSETILIMEKAYWKAKDAGLLEKDKAWQIMAHTSGIQHDGARASDCY